MNWWNQTRLAGFRGQLAVKLRRAFLPYWAVFQTDLQSQARSWVLRAWLVLTTLVALVTLLNHSAPDPAEQPTGVVIAVLLHPVDTSSGASHTLGALLKLYVVIWASFVIVLTSGAISSELGVVADVVLSRGISRWQYFLGKWTARLLAVLAVYLLVMIPTGLVLWLGASSAGTASGPMSSPRDPGAPGMQAELVPAEINLVPSNDYSLSPPGERGGVRGPDEAKTGRYSWTTPQAPSPLPTNPTLSLAGMSFGLARVAAVLTFVVTCGVALSASFGSSIISIAVGWVTLYGTGVLLSILDLSRFSPTRLIREMPAVLCGNYVASEQCWLIAGWLALTLAVALPSGIFFARRDV